MANFPGNALRVYAMNVTAPVTISTASKQYFGGDYQCDFPANFFANARLIHVVARGIYTVPTLSVATLNMGLDVVAANTTTVAQLGVITPLVSNGARGWMMDEMLVSQSGSKLTVPCPTYPNGFAGFSTGAALGTANFATLTQATALDVDTTQAISLRIWAQWGGTLLGGTSITLQVFTVMVSD